jgi:MutS domain V
VVDLDKTNRYRPFTVSHVPPNKDSSRREPALRRTLRRLTGRIDLAVEASARFTRWRLIIFLVGATATVAPYKLGWYQTGNAALVFFLGCFAVVAWHHNRVERRLHRLRLWREVKQTHLARLQLDWKTIPDRPFATPDTHSYAKDLDFLGPHSLLHLLDTTVSTQGRHRLDSWFLTQPPRPDQWKSRQALIKELAPLSLLRDRIVLEARLIDRRDIDGAALLAILGTPAGYPGLLSLLIIEAILAVLTVILLIADLLAGVPDYWIGSFALYAFIYLMVRGRTADVFNHAVALHGQLEKVAAVFRHFEQRSLASAPTLAQLCEPLRQESVKPSRSLAKAASLLHRLSIKAHPLVHYVVNALGPWDLYHTYRLQGLQDHVAQAAPIWFDMFAEFEAASALANFAYLHPAYCWPEPIQGDREQGDSAAEPTNIGVELGHPLIPSTSRVANDLYLEGRGRILLVTGSNMSGKSTFLRTVGVNLCLAQAGGPVCAKHYRWTWAQPACCIRVDDSLETGLSFFYAEVKRLKAILSAAQQSDGPTVLFLIDEVFRGTNNRERLLGARAFIAALAQSRGFGLVTTHDLELTDLERRIDRLSNVHFQETVEQGRLAFDYKLRPGPCPTTNALRIMALEGLPVPGEANGEKS